MIRRLLSGSLVLSILVALGACNPTLTEFLVPNSVVTGELFEVEIAATLQSSGLGQNGAAAVLQVPVGMQVVDATLGGRSQYQLQRDDPDVLALFSPEPGRKLAAFSVSDSTASFPHPRDRLRVQLRAPAQRGTVDIKVGFAYQAASPAWTIGAQLSGDFSQINGGDYLRFVNVENVALASGTAWREASTGLPTSVTETGWSTAVADVNSDGLADLALQRAGDPSPRFYLSHAQDRWIESSQGLVAGAAPVDFGDSDGDGNLDLFCENGEVYLGNGGGRLGFGPRYRGRRQRRLQFLQGAPHR